MLVLDADRLFTSQGHALLADMAVVIIGTLGVSAL